jgi:KDO2-lipid IV(A) lauroyltransferase
MFLLRIISRLPFRVLYAISDFLFFFCYYIIRYRRQLVWRNLKNSFPEKSLEELTKIERDFYKNLCDYGVEIIKLLTISKEELGARMVFKNQEIIERYNQQKQSVFFLASHQFNWEWLLTKACFAFPMGIDFIYQPLNNDFFNRFSLECRTRFGGHAIKRDEVAREIIKRKNIIRGIASVTDQYPGHGNDKRYQTIFLNQETVFFYGTNQLIALTQYPVIFYGLKKIKRGFYEASPVEVAVPPYLKDDTWMIEKYVRAVENIIRENPSSWLWSHNRWKKRHLTQA